MVFTENEFKVTESVNNKRLWLGESLTLERVLTIFSPMYEKLFYFPGDIKDYYEQGTNFENVRESFKSLKDGTQMHVLTLASSNPIGRIVHCHGSGFNMSKHFTHINWLPVLGFEVVMFDYPGYGKSTGTPTRCSTVEAAKEIITFCSQKDDLPLFVLGQSLGGNIAAVALSDSEIAKLVRGCIFDSMYSSFRALGEVKLRRKYAGWLAIIAKCMALFISDFRSPIKLACKVKTPLLILHSRRDSVVPLQESVSFYERVGSVDCELLSHGTSDHTEVLRHNVNSYRESIVGWMKRYIN